MTVCVLCTTTARHAAPKGNDLDYSCLHGISISELVVFLEENESDEDSASFFKLKTSVVQRQTGAAWSDCREMYSHHQTEKQTAF